MLNISTRSLTGVTKNVQKVSDVNDWYPFVPEFDGATTLTLMLAKSMIFFTNVSRALQNRLSKFVYCRSRFSYENFKLKLTLCVCPKPCFGHTCKVLAWNFHHKCDFWRCIFSWDNLVSSRNVSETPPWLHHVLTNPSAHAHQPCTICAHQPQNTCSPTLKHMCSPMSEYMLTNPEPYVLINPGTPAHQVGTTCSQPCPLSLGWP